jgi:hypothetical protein
LVGELIKYVAPGLQGRAISQQDDCRWDKPEVMDGMLDNTTTTEQRKPFWYIRSIGTPARVVRSFFGAGITRRRSACGEFE